MLSLVHVWSDCSYCAPEVDVGPPKSGSSYDKVVGITTPEGREFWVPRKIATHAYDGYSSGDITELAIPFDETLSARLTSFFEKQLLRCLDMNRPTDKYDYAAYNCHWFAFWMQGAVTSTIRNTSHSLPMAEKVINNGVIISPATLRLGQIGVIGGMDLYEGPAAEHSIVALDGHRGLQVLGDQGPLVVVAHDSALRHYRMISQGRYTIPDEDYGMHVLAA